MHYGSGICTGIQIWLDGDIEYALGSTSGLEGQTWWVDTEIQRLIALQVEVERLGIGTGCMIESTSTI